MDTSKEIPFQTDQKTVRVYEDVRIHVKVKLSALWIVLMFYYTYADILGFYAPGNIAELMSGEIAGIQLTQEMLLSSTLLMAVPSVMVFLSLSLKAKASRLVNIIVGFVYLLVLGSTLFTGRNLPYYLLYATFKAMILALIILLAWNWPKQNT